MLFLRKAQIPTTCNSNNKRPVKLPSRIGDRDGMGQNPFLLLQQACQHNAQTVILTYDMSCNAKFVVNILMIKEPFIKGLFDLLLLFLLAICYPKAGS